MCTEISIATPWPHIFSLPHSNRLDKYRTRHKIPTYNNLDNGYLEDFKTPRLSLRPTPLNHPFSPETVDI